MSKGYRGYISSHMIERSVPQHIQQLVIRDYCTRNNLKFLLSATEYHEGTMMLKSINNEGIEGVVFYSIYQLPEEKSKREICWPFSFSPIHFAAENIKVTSVAEWNKLEDIFLLRSILCRK